MSEDSAEKIKEKEMELSLLKIKEDKLYDLASKTLGKFLRSTTRETAMQSLYEYLFITLASVQCDSILLRLGAYPGEEPEEREDNYDRPNQYMQIIENVKKGDWKNAKDEAFLDLDDVVFVMDDAKRLGFGADFKISEHKIFLDKNEKSKKLWFEFIKEKLNLVPDVTEPYSYPKLEELKAKVASI